MRIPDYFDRYDADEYPEYEPPTREVRCRHCGSTNVKRWRALGKPQQLVSSITGLVHECQTTPPAFAVEPE